MFELSGSGGVRCARWWTWRKRLPSLAQRELYDLWKDPGEFHNIAELSRYKERVAAMHSALVAELGERPQQTERRCRADYARGYNRGNEGKV